MADEYSLKWNKHQNTVVNCLSALRQSCSFVDVTLHTSDGHTFSAHKVVLSACSSFFESVFKLHATDKIAVFLKDISHTDLRFIMEFVYSGEISVSRSSLPSLLNAAEALGIKGLCRSPEEHEPPTNTVEKGGIDPSPKKKRFKADTPVDIVEDEDAARLMAVTAPVIENVASVPSYPCVKSELVDTKEGLEENQESMDLAQGGFVPSDGSEESMPADPTEISVEVFETEGLEDGARPCSNGVTFSSVSDAVDLATLEENLSRSIARWCEARTDLLTGGFHEGDNFYIETFINNGKVGGRFICLKCNPVSVIKVTGVDDVIGCGRKTKWDKRNICRHIVSKHYKKVVQ